MKRSKKIREAVLMRNCIADGCGGKARRRGLCKACSAKFYYRRRRMTPNEFAEFERRAIEMGLILAVGEAAKMFPRTDQFTKAESDD